MNEALNYDYIVIGKGVAAYSLLFKMTQSDKFLNKKILNVYDEAAFPACSHRTTSIISTGAHKKGLSKLGDILVDSEQAFLAFMNNNPQGVYPSRQRYLLTSDEEKRNRLIDRYGDNILAVDGVEFIDCPAFTVVPAQLYAWFEKQIEDSRLQIVTKEISVTSINENNNTITTDQGDFTYSKLVLATGAYTSVLLTDNNMPAGKPVSGSYYLWRNDNTFDEDVFYSLGHFNVIYRKATKELLFGGTSFEGPVYLEDNYELENEYRKMQDALSFVGLPSSASAEKYTGVRHKGKRRVPFFDQVRGNIFAIHSLYRNAYTFCYLAADTIIHKL